MDAEREDWIKAARIIAETFEPIDDNQEFLRDIIKELVAEMDKREHAADFDKLNAKWKSWDEGWIAGTKDAFETRHRERTRNSQNPYQRDLMRRLGIKLPAPWAAL